MNSARSRRRLVPPGRRRVWFLQTRDPDDTTLNLGFTYRLRGPVEAARLRAAAESVAARHEILCTSYGSDADGEPYEVIRPDIALAWQEHDLSGSPPAGAHRRAEVLVQREMGRTFDLTSEAPWRITLIRAGAQEYVLLLVVHTIAWDDESSAVFAAELTAAYNDVTGVPTPARSADRSDAPPIAPDGPDYWRRTLSPLPEALELPGRPAAETPGPPARRRLDVPLPPELLGLVRDAATAHDTDVAAVLSAAYAVVIQRCTAAADFLVAMPVDMRGPETAAAIGYFGNILLIRFAPEPDQTFTEFLARIGTTMRSASSHRDVGIDEVVQAINPGRTGAHDGLEHVVRVAFGVRGRVPVPALDGITATVEMFGSPVVPVAMQVTAVLDPDQPCLAADFRPDVLDGRTVGRLLNHLVQLLAAAVRTPDRPLGELDLFSEPEYARLLAVSQGELVAVEPTTLVSLVEDRVARATSATAVVAPAADDDADLELTYGELNARANRLARWLVRRHIGTEDLVGIRIANSVEFLVAVLAVLKAGAAYLPIDPAYPDARIGFLITDSDPRLVLDRSGLAHAETEAASLSARDLADADRIRPLRPDNLAYVIYTSGSTGNPKGVPVAHAAIADHICGFAAEWDMTADDRLLQSSSVSFDASLLDIFVTLTLGACLVVPKPDALRDIPYLADLMTRYDVTVLHMAPSVLNTFLMVPDVIEWSALRHVPVGGEALLGEVADRFARAFDAELRNHYGPTEAVVSATHHAVHGPQGAGIVPVGVPNRNVYAYLLDDRLQVVPDGVLGEIYLGGPQLARGYLRRCRLTAERFVADPFRRGQRLYRTGDLARRHPEGEIEFVGRADEQVKVRGYRIELGEVQAALSTHPAVGACAVVAVQESGLGTGLAAYLVPATDGLETAEVRAYAAKSLPDYMLPATWAIIDEIPLTEHGKLDKRALPESRRLVSGVSRPPGTPTETRLADLFGEIFDQDGISADDSFFELGGHSLLANRLVLLIRAEFGVAVDIRAIFDNPTVAGCAALIEATPVAGGARPELVRRPRPDRIPLSDNQWAVVQTGDVNPLWSVARLDGPVDVDALTDAVHDVFARHEILRTVVAGVPDGWYQTVLPGLSPEFAVTAVTEDELAAGLAEMRSPGFDRTVGPLLRARVFALGRDRHVLAVAADRLVADEWTLRLVLTDLATAYRSRAGAGAAPPWAAPAIGYADYTLWQRAVAESADDERRRWGAAAFADAPGSAVASAEHFAVAAGPGRVAEFSVPALQRRRLRAYADTVGASEFMLYQAAIAVLLHTFGAGTDFALGAPISGRRASILGDVAGPLSAAVVLRHDLSGDPTLRTVLDRTRATALRVYGDQGISLDGGVATTHSGRALHELCRAVVDFRERSWPARIGLGDETCLHVLEVAGEMPHRLVFACTATADGGLEVTVRADADRHDQATTNLLARGLERTLAVFSEAPDLPISELELSAAEQSGPRA